ncbi:MAG: hypothetical protein C0601_06675 [Candidatus Muiribacterium halophilum]|uniref:Uncharacterized protein n=1 Tax=Muiribacterium halophilum TaxID=2053465 RepID=A0A2N5ZG74_MUIH1|nr:MAG: hypothetical protein C0601_06675 [Candidatus Muirbacterium halophilum]
MEKIKTNDFQQIIKALLKRSARNITFRERLITAPEEAYTELTGEMFPSNMCLKIKEDSGKITQVIIDKRDDYSRSFYWDLGNSLKEA